MIEEAKARESKDKMRKADYHGEGDDEEDEDGSSKHADNSANTETAASCVTHIASCQSKLLHSLIEDFQCSQAAVYR